jgi:alginate O-acetyltransferase complex protein AlgI
MIFSSATFLFYFLPITIFAYFITPRFLKNYTLLFASLVFYSWGQCEYIPLLLISILLNYCFGRLLQQPSTPAKKAVLAIGITLNLAILCVFKYMDFLIEAINLLIVFLGFQTLDITNIVLPLGISFFTFHSIAYLVDVYRTDATPEKSLLAIALYIALFPKIIAGPIIPFRDIQKALRTRPHNLELFVKGCKLLIIGLSLKILIADILANPANEIYALPAEYLSPALAWTASVCYTFQIYFDFAGYSIMAMGLGFMFGFSIPQNFNFPYVSGSISEFWRRWHITLTNWFRNYLYIPLGGNRKGRIREYLNLITVFLLCGLWHGASWMFVLWGMYHGIFLIIERLFLLKRLERFPSFVRSFYALMIINIGWVLFRSADAATAKQMLASMLLFKNSAQSTYCLRQFIGNDVLIALLLAIIFSIPPDYYKNLSKKYSRNFTKSIAGAEYG